MIYVEMSSKERIMAAINIKEPDYIPLLFTFLDYTRWDNQFQRAKELLKLGVDDIVDVHVPVKFHPDVSTSISKEKNSKEKYPILQKKYSTPAGALLTSVKKTDDWPHGRDIPLFSDFNDSRAIKPLITGPEDLPKLKYLLQIPNTGDELNKLRKNCSQVINFARENKIVVQGYVGTIIDTAVWLCGAENLLYEAIDRPDYFKKLLKIIHDWEMKRLELVIDYDIDVIIHRAWYETTDFWSPNQYREYISPLLEEEVKLAHQMDKKFGYIMSTGVMPLLDEFLKLNIDMLINVDPVMGNTDIKILKEKIGDKICIQGGVNSYITLERGSKKEIEKAVHEAINTLGEGGGFILKPVDSIQKPWDKIKEKFYYFIDIWKQLRR